MKSSLLLTCLLLFSLPLAAQQQPFDQWLSELRSEATSRGISASTLQALDGIEPLERVVALDNNQPELVMTLTRYLDITISDRRIRQGREYLQQHDDLLQEVQARYGIQPHYLMSFWALESDYGRNTGDFSVLQSLATLAWEPRRADYFREELLTALEIIDAGHVTATQMTGSWAGAMGQLQFMPTNFARFAVDGDGDGKIDIWNSLPDVLHSTANFLASYGWNEAQPWGQEVILPDTFDYSLVGRDTTRQVSGWNSLGVTGIDGQQLAESDLDASIILPSGAQGPAFMVFENFRVTLRYNPPELYGISVGYLAERINGGPVIARMPENEQAISDRDIEEIQQLLNDHGYDAGAPDGRVGPRTRGAIRAFQQDNGLPEDAFASFPLLEKLRSI